MRVGKRMDSSEPGFIDNDGMQQPLLVDQQDNDDVYRTESSSPACKILLHSIIINIIMFR